VVSSAAIESKLGLASTPIAEGFRTTVAWWKSVVGTQSA
jgi:hypothetical protein